MVPSWRLFKVPSTRMPRTNRGSRSLSNPSCNLFREAAIHMSKYRVRCGQCSKNFCSKCKVEPYHQGKTCEQHKEFKEARKCRYCWLQLTEPSLIANPAFMDVCRAPACLENVKKSCEKILPCGHYCCGFKDERICLPCLNEECV